MSAVDLAGAVDRMLGDIAGLGDQLRTSEAAARELPVLRQPGAVCISGLGGSAISADLAVGLWGTAARVPIVVRRDSTLPGFVGRDSLLVALSYSGETVETLRCAESALSRGAQLVAITGGGSLGALAGSAGAPVVPLPCGMQPRAAVGYLFAALAVTLEQARVIPDVSADLAAAAAACDVVAGVQGGPGARRLGAELATCTTWIGGAGPLAPVARRWKTQLNENAKALAFHGPLPEADHNEIVGWAGARRGGGRNAAILLTDPEDSPRLAASVRFTLETIEPDTDVREALRGEGETRAARAFWLLSVGDHVSTFAAEAAGVDPYEIDRLSTLKARLPLH